MSSNLAVMRKIPDSLDPIIVSAIDDRRQEVCTRELVRIPWAIESGSRAWGFPSPDSDYDCRFIYIRRTEDYLSLWPQRDVIETPLDKIFDVNGWDIAKAIKLMAKGNATVVEWLRSPIIYRGDRRFRERLLTLAQDIVEPAKLRQHYLSLGRRQQELADSSLKKFFYALRPAAALRWLRTNSVDPIPPMQLQELLIASEAPGHVLALVRDLIELKAQTREMGQGAVPQGLREFVAREFELAEAEPPTEQPLGLQRRAQLDDFYRSAVQGWD